MRIYEYICVYMRIYKYGAARALGVVYTHICTYIREHTHKYAYIRITQMHTVVEQQEHSALYILIYAHIYAFILINTHIYA